jgi:glycosyltransferase involved in cell wall biosynthesis
MNFDASHDIVHVTGGNCIHPNAVWCPLDCQRADQLIYSTFASAIGRKPRNARARGSNDTVVRLLSIGSVVPDKGYDLLIAALATIPDLPWRLTIAGDRTRNLAAAARLDADISAHGLGDRVAVLGAVPPERVIELCLGSDLFVLASRFEGYGMALAEAIAHGLPVVSTTAGAISDTVPAGTGLLVPPGDVAALVQALRRLISDRAERQQLAMNARAAATQLPTWPNSARLFAGAIEAAGDEWCTPPDKQLLWAPREA